MADEKSSTDGSIISRWKEMLLSPTNNQWHVFEVVLAIIATTTVAYFWSKILDDVFDVTKEIIP